MNLHIKRVTQDGHQICFNHAVLATNLGVAVVETLSSDTFGYCEWCEDGIPLEIQALKSKEEIKNGL